MPHLSPTLDSPSPTQTAVIVPVPAAESLVGQYRRELDPADKWGVPAHVTVLYPFVEPTAANESVVATLASILEPITAFDCCFLQTRWFGEDVLWLDPDPAEPFHRLTNAVWGAFPSCPPYGGAHQDVIPHLTVGECRQSDLLALEVAEQAVQSDLPLSARIDQVLWIAGTQALSSWRVIQGFNLRTPSPDHLTNAAEA